MPGLRRLSHAISEGDGISILVEVGDADAARAAAEQGADGLVLRRPAPGLRAATHLPVVAFAVDDTDADAIVVDGNRDDDELDALVGGLAERGVEWVVRVTDEERLEEVLEQLDPEIVLLSAGEYGGDETPLERLLDLLPDVPAGKLAIAELAEPTRDQVDELERAGVDAVLVAGGDVSRLVDEPHPEI